MKKKMSVLLALSMLVLTACSGKSAPQTTAAPQTESAAAGTESSDKTEAAGENRWRSRIPTPGPWP